MVPDAHLPQFASRTTGKNHDYDTTLSVGAQAGKNSYFFFTRKINHAKIIARKGATVNGWP